jgi:uroporphyrinogen-III synthase
MTPCARPFIVTRPAAAGRALTDSLAARGCDARWLPAFEIGPAPDPARAAAVLARLADFDLALFVSPAAVRAAACLLGELPGARDWPAATAVGAVGPGTAAAIRAHLRGGWPALVAPAAGDAADSGDNEADTGSEAYWQAQLAHERATGARARRVLILRAAQGRDWLQQHFAQAGAEVVPLAVYAREPRGWSAEDAAWVAARAGGPAPVLVVTSSEAVDSVIAAAQAADAAGAALDWLRRGRALALHPRIVARLRTAGFGDAACVPCEVDALLAAA